MFLKHGAKVVAQRDSNPSLVTAAFSPRFSTASVPLDFEEIRRD